MKSINASGATPYFFESRVTLTSIRILRFADWSCASRESLRARFRLSSECSQEKFPGMNLALLVCRWPTKCHVMDGFARCEIFGRASCVVLSPKSFCPAEIAAATASCEWVFETAIRRISSGFLPASFAVSSMDCRTRNKWLAIASKVWFINCMLPRSEKKIHLSTLRANWIWG